MNSGLDQPHGALQGPQREFLALLSDASFAPYAVLRGVSFVRISLRPLDTLGLWPNFRL